MLQHDPEHEITTTAAGVDDAEQWSWLHGEIEWKLHDSQKVIHNQIEVLPRDVKEAVILCCRRFGKSYYGCWRAVWRGLNSDRRTITRIIGPTIEQTVMIVEHNMAKLTESLDRLGIRYLVKYVKSENCYRIGPFGLLYLGGFDSQEDSLRGGEADEILIEETGSSDPDQYNYQMKSVLKPQLLKTRGRMIHLTTLPPVPDHPFTNDTIPQAKLDNAFYSFTIYEDPLATPEIIADAIKDSGGESSITFRREYLNEQVRDPNVVVVPTFDKAQHVVRFEAPTSTKFQVSIDFGGSRDKTVGLLMTYDFLSDIDMVLDELVFPASTSTSDIVRALKDWERRFKIEIRFADAPGQVSVDLAQDYDYPVSMPQKSDWQAGINQMIARFQRGKILVHERCKFLSLSLESGTLNKNRNDFARTEALGHCDALAALMYGIRCLDRTNPWGREAPSIDNHIVFPKETVEQQVAEAMLPKVFGGTVRKFGKFRA